MIYLLKSAIWLSVFWVIYYIFLRKGTFFRFNRFFLISGLVLSWLLPAIQYRYVVYINRPGHMNITLTDTIPEIVSSGVNTGLIMWGIYLSISIILLLINLFGLNKIRSLIVTGEPIAIGKYKLIDSSTFNTPFSAFNYIFLNSSVLTEGDKKMILDHELAHVNQFHWVDLLTARLICAFQWFNPLAWLYVRSIRENHEYLADETVIRKGNSPAMYRALLVSSGLHIPVSQLVHSFVNNTNYLNRFSMMRKTNSSTIRKWAVLLLLPVACVILWAFAEPRYVVQNSDSPNITMTKIQSLDVDSTHSLVVVGYQKTNDLNLDAMNVKSGSPVLTVSGYADIARSDTDSVIASSGETSLKGNLSWNLSPENQPLILLDGNEISFEEMESIDTEMIESVSVLKDKSSTDAYGEKAKNGVILITSQKTGKPVGGNNSPVKTDNKANVSTPKPVLTSLEGNDAPLFVVDGRIVSSIENIKPEDIDLISVLKDKSATDIYGDKGRNGVVLITMKKK